MFLFLILFWIRYVIALRGGFKEVFPFKGGNYFPISYSCIFVLYGNDLPLRISWHGIKYKHINVLKYTRDSSLWCINNCISSLKETIYNILYYITDVLYIYTSTFLYIYIYIILHIPIMYVPTCLATWVLSVLQQYFLI